MNVLDPVFLRDLNSFLGRATLQTYAGNGLPVPPRDTQRSPGFKELVYREGSWLYRDSYTGFLTSAGQEIVCYNDVPVWSQSYAGGMRERYRDPDLARDCFRFLKDALTAGGRPHAFQPRGPRLHEESGWRYVCTWNGDITDFQGQETIRCSGSTSIIFFHRFFGGVILHGLPE
ncbi:hypothetical protein HY631_00315 [Candidatus Uhrbacteria bacterium]|nr:hypothetical protein [Candidatus Uhrbacteria bacterium]